MPLHVVIAITASALAFLVLSVTLVPCWRADYLRAGTSANMSVDCFVKADQFPFLLSLIT